MSPTTKRLAAGVSASEIFLESVNRGMGIIFADSAKAGAKVGNVSIELHFEPDSKLTMHAYAYNIVSYEGTYEVNENGGLTIVLGDQEWPSMIVSVEGDYLVLNRKDGLHEFKGYWNLYPEAVDNVFPFRAKQTMQNKAAMVR